MEFFFGGSFGRPKSSIDESGNGENFSEKNVINKNKNQNICNISNKF
jgi:hypothetical protein